MEPSGRIGAASATVKVSAMMVGRVMVLIVVIVDGCLGLGVVGFGLVVR